MTWVPTSTVEEPTPTGTLKIVVAGAGRDAAGGAKGELIPLLIMLPNPVVAGAGAGLGPPMPRDMVGGGGGGSLLAGGAFPGLFWCPLAVGSGLAGTVGAGGWKTGGADVGGATTGIGVFFVTITVLV
jgi:hypothetical protein